MKTVSKTVLAIAGITTSAFALGLAPIPTSALSGGLGVAITGAGMILCGMALRGRGAEAEAQAGLTPGLAPLPSFFAEERARYSAEIIPFGRKSVENPAVIEAEMPAMLEAHLNQQMLRRAERLLARERP